MEMSTGTQRGGLAAAAMSSASLRQRLRDYVTLTKPHIISLLLVTTVAPMIAAAGGWPNVWLVVWTMVGGYLMAGGANAMNMYIDRDIDPLMGRTALRPIPAGRMSAGHVFGFGLILAAVAFAIFATQVNLLAAWLALAGYLYYVLIYSRWLKRTTPQNIVIGGGAGAFPPLVGWVAVTGELSWVALGLFAVVVLWTPPHFWALALVKKNDYGRAGVPMAPNVWGDRRTIRQMIAYTVVLVALTALLVIDPRVGFVYGISALLLGGWFLRAVIRLWRAPVLTQPAWAVYRCSLLYLALLFAALAFDGLVGYPTWIMAATPVVMP